ncbi:amidohydrolase [Catenulispora acidiphila DSM 44928]|uniref:Amidohydrolase n=1 Tax=Catenulispora acidiphila (strain DSM 44928 / JCM 14897 / NBRC 102108 / NRRL B-24433 / ID139908) TaxID=479433 RepID=C7QGU8_CATAD|nr:M20 family metallopeptidase [Catenulispora acidiphila]ACU76798.1 amidohydrolase [Catenulispora acidiphila DSM 44928]
MTYTDDAKGLQEDLVRLRRDLHRIPEIGLNLPRTQERVLAALDGLPLEITLGSELNSVTAVLRGTGPAAGGEGSARAEGSAQPQKQAVLLRGDMDALPVVEKTGRDFAAAGPNMHACGHDLHTAMLVGAARLLSGRRDRLAGDVVFMFQPGEEGDDGAGHMIREGVLDAAGPRVIGAYGLHVMSDRLPRGQFVSRAGTFMAGADEIAVTVRGAGAHGSLPHTGKDPIPVACEMVVALQSMVTRKFDIFDPVVITVGAFQAGTAANIIPDDATFQVTMRSFSRESRARMLDVVVDLFNGLAAAYGCGVDITYKEQYPPTVNHAPEVDFLEEVTREVHGEERFARIPNPVPGAEDFSRVLEEVSGTYAFLGACTVEDFASSPSNHSPLADFDDAVLGDGAALLAELADRRLARG